MKKGMVLGLLVLGIAATLFYYKQEIAQIISPQIDGPGISPRHSKAIDRSEGPFEVKLPDGRTVSWPPKLGEKYPDLALYDPTGKLVRLSDFKNKVLLIEPIAMDCTACNAWSGAYLHGDFQGVKKQTDLKSFEKHFKNQVKNFDIDDPRILWVHIIFYDLFRQAPDLEDVKAWADHFKNEEREMLFLLAGQNFQGNETFHLIPGFQIVDKNFILRADATGHQPAENLYTSLMPKLPGIVEEIELPPL